MFKISKIFQSPFAIDKPKLSRIISIVEQRFKSAGENINIGCNVELRDQRVINVNTIDELFLLDNTIKNPITSMDITIKDNLPDIVTSKDTTKYYVNIEYDGKVFGRGFSYITLTVASLNSKWTNQIFDEIEEQIERTLLNNFVYKYLKSSALLPLVILVITLATLYGIASFNIHKPVKLEKNEIGYFVDNIPLQRHKKRKRTSYTMCVCSN